MRVVPLYPSLLPTSGEKLERVAFMGSSANTLVQSNAL